MSKHTVTFASETTHNWTPYPEANLYFLKSTQNWMNDRLAAHGYLFVNEVFEHLGFPRTRDGQLEGWLASEGDVVDFGLFTAETSVDLTGDEFTIVLNTERSIIDHI